MSAIRTRSFLQIFTSLLAVLILFAGFSASAANTTTTVTPKAATVAALRPGSYQKGLPAPVATSATPSKKKTPVPSHQLSPTQSTKTLKTTATAALRPVAPRPVMRAQRTALSDSLQAKISTKEKKPEPKMWNVALNFAHLRPMVDHQDGSYSEGQTYTFILGSKVGDNWNATVIGAYSRDLKTPEASDWVDTQLFFKRKSFEITKSLMMNYGAIGIIPNSKDSSIRQNMQGALGGSLGISVNPKSLVEGFSLSASLSLIRLSHSYETSTDGKVLSPWSFKQTIAAGYSIGDFSIGGSFIHRNAYTYGGNMKESFEHSEEIGYNVSQNFSVALGHYLSGSALKPNGYESNLSLIDENNSLVYAGFTVSY